MSNSQSEGGGGQSVTISTLHNSYRLGYNPSWDVIGTSRVMSLLHCDVPLIWKMWIPNGVINMSNLLLCCIAMGCHVMG